MSAITDKIRAKASEIYHGDVICQEKSKFLLTEMNLPNGLLPLEDIEECGYIKDTGFVWLIQKKKKQHKFEKIDRNVQYATEVTAYVEPNKIKKLTGVKTKELLLWVTLCDIYVDDPPTGKITFKTPTGLFRTFPISAFQIEEDPKAVKEKDGATEVEVKDIKCPVDGSDAAVKDIKGEVNGADVEVKDKAAADVEVKEKAEVNAAPAAAVEVKNV